MSRSPVVLREATLADAEKLAELWQHFLRRGTDQQLHDVATAIEEVAVEPKARLVVAEYDGVLAGAALLKATTCSPINPEPVLQVHHAAVVSALRRRGIGRALMDAAVTWAEELGIGHVATAALSGSREANRFMARLALGPQAVLRIAPTPAVRAMLTTRNPGARQVTQVLAVRRSLRHARSMSRSV
jgi:GNAT superfamily N-acetyltransferase